MRILASVFFACLALSTYSELGAQTIQLSGLDTNREVWFRSNSIAKRYIKVTNTSSLLLDIWPDQSSGYKIFEVTDDKWPGELLKPGKSMNIIVTFDSRVKQMTGSVAHARIYVKNMNGTGQDLDTIYLTGYKDTTSAGRYAVTRDSVFDFGRIAIDSPAVRNVEFTNSYSKPITVTSANLYSFFFSKYYSMASGQPTFPFTVQPGGKFTIPVRFAPDSLMETWGTDLDVQYSIGGIQQTITTELRGKGGPGAIVTGDSLNFGTLAKYLYLFKSVPVTNHTEKDIILLDDQMLFFNGVQIWMMGDDTLQYVKMKPRETKDLVFLIYADSAQAINEDYYFSVLPGKPPYEPLAYNSVSIRGNVVEMSVDSIPLFKNQTTFTPLNSVSDTDFGTYTYFNSSDDTITVNEAALSGDYFFHIFSFSKGEPPFVLAPKESFSTSFVLSAEDSDYYVDYFLIRTDSGYLPNSVSDSKEIPGITLPKEPQSRVAEELVAHHLSAYPNPVQESVRFSSGIERGAFVITNTLGKVVHSGMVHAGKFEWNRQTSHGPQATAGTYFVRVLGESQGKRVQSATSIVLE